MKVNENDIAVRRQTVYLTAMSFFLLGRLIFDGTEIFFAYTA